MNVISKKRERSDTEFTPSDKDKGAKCSANPLIRIIDGASFYDLAFQRKNVLREIHQTVPIIVNRIAERDNTISSISQNDITFLIEYSKRAFPI